MTHVSIKVGRTMFLEERWAKNRKVLVRFNSISSDSKAVSAKCEVCKSHSKIHMFLSVIRPQ